MTMKKAGVLFGSLLAILIVVTFGFPVKTEAKLPNKFVRGEIEPITKRVVIGPYPERREVMALRKNGFQNIISLLHPQIPFEKHLLNKEKSAVHGTGVTLHSLPLKPFVSRANDKNLDKLAQLIKDHPDQKYYIHCYLGKHRVTYAKARVLRTLGRKTRVQKPVPITKNLLRGNVTKLGKGVYFGPAPTDEEVFDLYSGRIRTIISVLDFKNKGDRGFIKKLSRLCADYNLKFHNVSMVADQPNHEEIERLADILAKAKRPIYITSFTGEDRAGDVRAAVDKAQSIKSSGYLLYLIRKDWF